MVFPSTKAKDISVKLNDHIRILACRCFFWISQLCSVRRTLTYDTIIALVNALVISRLGYCNSVLVGAYDIHLQQLQGVLNAAARLIAGGRKFDSISSTIRDVLHWLPIRQRVDFKLSVLMFNCLRNLAPSYLMNMYQSVTSNLHRRRLRSAVRGDLIHSLPDNLRNPIIGRNSFRQSLKTFLFATY